jgi:hypothetical protein
MQSCTVCRHPERASIEAALVHHTPFRKIGTQFGVGYSAVVRHQKHVLAKLAKAREGIELAEATTLFAKVDQVLQDARRITERAEKKGDLQTALQGLRTITGSLGLLGRITGEIQQQNTSVQFHAHLHRSTAPVDDADLEFEIAQHVSEATDGFNPLAIARLKGLLSDGHDSAMMTVEGALNQ